MIEEMLARILDDCEKLDYRISLAMKMRNMGKSQDIRAIASCLLSLTPDSHYEKISRDYTIIVYLAESLAKACLQNPEGTDKITDSTIKTG